MPYLVTARRLRAMFMEADRLAQSTMAQINAQRALGEREGDAQVWVRKDTARSRIVAQIASLRLATLMQEAGLVVLFRDSEPRRIEREEAQ